MYIGTGTHLYYHATFHIDTYNHMKASTEFLFTKFTDETLASLKISQLWSSVCYTQLHDTPLTGICIAYMGVDYIQILDS